MMKGWDRRDKDWEVGGWDRNGGRMVVVVWVRGINKGLVGDCVRVND